MSAKCLITGAQGILGQDLQVVFPGAAALGRSQLDITDAAQVQEAVGGYELIINAAAYTQVDKAEQESELAYAVNEVGADNLAQAAAAAGARLVHISTDYVFSGAANEPYPEDHPHGALSVYGQSKAAGEQAVRRAHPQGSFIVRTSWLYGQHGSNFVRTMLRLASEHETVSVVDDQRGQPTWSLDLAWQIRRLTDSGAAAGIYHGTNSGQTTWFGFAQKIFALAGYDPARVLPTDSAAFVRPAPRPAYSCLGHEAWAKAGLPAMRTWDAALEAAWESGIFA